jgi:hypothetical protein
MVTVTEGWFHFYVQKCADSAIVHEFFNNSWNSVSVVRTPCTAQEAFARREMNNSPVIYKGKLIEVFTICSA